MRDNYSGQRTETSTAYTVGDCELAHARTLSRKYEANSLLSSETMPRYRSRLPNTNTNSVAQPFTLPLDPALPEHIQRNSTTSHLWLQQEWLNGSEGVHQAHELNPGVARYVRLPNGRVYLQRGTAHHAGWAYAGANSLRV